MVSLALIAGCGAESPVPRSKHVDPQTTVLVGAGKFWMGCALLDTACSQDEHPRREIYLDAFHIDKTEVTVADYSQCIGRGRCTTPKTSAACNWGKSDRGDHPINCVDWEQAKAYCAWAGKRLPTDAEWEKAARGTDGRIFPWGDQPASCSRAVMDNGSDGCGKLGTWSVGSKPGGASPHGALDMAGNVWEWVSDWYAGPSRAGTSYYAALPKRNPKGPVSGTRRVARGGSWLYGGGCPEDCEALKASIRGSFTPRGRHKDVGFRCVKDIE